MVLQARIIGGRETGPHLLITGGVHGDEFEPMVAIRRLIAVPELAFIRGKLTLVPAVNENALARGQRVGDDGLDLARTCPGRQDGSVTERTAHDLTKLIQSADYYIDLHTGGTVLSVWPMTGYMLHPDPAILEKQRGMARAFGLPVIWGTDASLQGRSMSAARDAKVPAIYAEYEGGGRCSEAGVQAYVQGCLNVMSHLGMLDSPGARSAWLGARSVSDLSRERQRPSESPPIPLIVEDPRPNSGHMQRCYPSPADGCFESAVELGQPIETGQMLGAVVNPLGEQRHEVFSTQAGRVLVLRTFPSVRKGDSLGVVLETPTL